MDKFFVESLQSFLKPFEGKSLWITILVGNIRSIGANKYFHGPLIDGFVNVTGDTNRAKWKSRLKNMFLRVYDDPDQPNRYWVRDTSDMTVGEFYEFCIKCENYLMDELHGFIPEQKKKEFEDMMGIEPVQDEIPQQASVVDDSITW